MKLSRKDQARVNDTMRERQVDYDQRRHINCYRFHPTESPEHRQKKFDICCELYDQKLPFLVEPWTKGRANRPDVLDLVNNIAYEVETTEKRAERHGEDVVVVPIKKWNPHMSYEDTLVFYLRRSKIPEGKILTIISYTQKILQRTQRPKKEKQLMAFTAALMYIFRLMVGEPITQEKICKELHISPVTLRKYYKNILEEHGEVFLAKQDPNFVM